MLRGVGAIVAPVRTASVICRFLVRSLSSAAEDTVVSRCTAKISALLNPLRINVTSNNEDPNGSHVSTSKYYVVLLTH